MPITFEARASTPRDADVVGIAVASDGPVPRGVGLDRKALTRLGFEGKPGQVLAVPAKAGPLTIAVGVGPRDAVDAAVLRRAAAALTRAASRGTHLSTSLAGDSRIPARDAAQAVAEGCSLATYRFARYRTNGEAPTLERISLVGADARGVERGDAVAAAVAMARDLVNTAPADKNARDIADKAVEVASAAKLGVEVWDLERIRAERLGGVIGVNRGSVEEPRVVKLTWSPRNARGSLALVGKGITFDSGGLSIKTGEGMMTMKSDMSGAAAVLAAMSVLPVVKPRCAVHGYLVLTDNMSGGDAMKPGDVLRIRNGKTVEVLNTDAEGRLVLADGLSLAVEDGADAIIDVATLTGACIMALGNKIAGLLSNDDAFAAQVESAARRADEPVWRLPLPPDYRRLLDSAVADMKNIGSTPLWGAGGGGGGALTAGLFLSEFVGSTPWVHLDIAGPSWTDADEGIFSKGGTAFATRTLVELADTFKP